MKYKYEFEELSLDDNSKLLVMRVDDSIKLVTLFLFSDIQGRDPSYVLKAIDKVLNGESKYELISGNMCKVDVYKDFSEIYDKLAEDGKGNWCRIETEELREFVELWGKEMKNFREKNPY